MKNTILILFSFLTFATHGQTIIKVEKLSDKTYKVVTDKALIEGKKYDFKVIESGYSYTEGTVIIETPMPNVPSCENNDNFSITSVGYGNGQIDFGFNASNLSKGGYELLKDNQIVKIGYFAPTSNIVIIQTGQLLSGNYTLKITGESCNGIAQKGFTIAGNLPPIIENVPPITPPVGDWLRNEIRDFDVVAPKMLNQIDLSFIPDFEIPLHPNPRYKGQRVIENIFKGPDWRWQATAGNVLKKGYTHIDALALQVGTERQNDPYNNSFVSTIPLNQIVDIGGGENYQRLKLGVNHTADEMNQIPFGWYNDILNDYKYNVPQKFKGGDNTFKGNFIGFDLENGSMNLPFQDYVNRHVALTKALLDASSEETEVSLMYQSAPIQNAGFGVTREHYNGKADATWDTPCAMNENAQKYGMPLELVGKSLKNLSTRMRVKFEYYLYYEAYLPEGAKLENSEGTALKDWGGNDISILTHFDKKQPSFFHWAAHTAGGLGIQRPHLNGKTLMLQTNHFNLGGVGYYYRQHTDNQPRNTILKQNSEGLGKYTAPDYIIEGMADIAVFMGATYYQWESNARLNPVSRDLGVQVNQYPQESYKDYRGVGALAVAMKRLAVTKATIDNQAYSIADLIDGNEIYSCEKTEVDYLNVSNYQGKREVNPLDWIEYKLTPVLTIVNEKKNLIAIWACQAYASEQEEVEVFYTKNGYNFKQRVKVPKGKNKLYIYKLR